MTAMNKPLLVVAIGNASRGDDALGPALAASLRDDGWFDGDDVGLLEAYQLQVEDALSLSERRAVLFIDAARAGANRGAALQPLLPAVGPTAFTHALPPAALLALVPRVSASQPPPAWLLAIEGEAFELGAPLSVAASARLAAALPLARDWLRHQCSRSPTSSPSHAAAPCSPPAHTSSGPCRSPMTSSPRAASR